MILTNITISTRSHPQLIEALHNMQEIYIYKMILDKIAKSTMMIYLLCHNLANVQNYLLLKTNMPKYIKLMRRI